MASCAWISLKVKRTSRLATTATAQTMTPARTVAWWRGGDGITRADLAQEDRRFEACDDGNDIDIDACRNTCEAARAAMGRGPGEGCDDGNLNPADDCVDRQPASCGDGRIQPGELCDDGTDDDTDACTNRCALAAAAMAWCAPTPKAVMTASNQQDACTNRCVSPLR